LYKGLLTTRRHPELNLTTVMRKLDEKIAPALGPAFNETEIDPESSSWDDWFTIMTTMVPNKPLALIHSSG